MQYNLIKPWETLDPWQQELLKTEGNIALRSGRQVGKSTIISIKAGEYAINNPHKNIMIIASVERQAYLLFEKVLSYIYNTHKEMIKTGKDWKTGQTFSPTKTKIHLKNGSVIHCLPTGDSGYGIRGYTIDLLIADEAAFIPEEVWVAVTPMLTITKGHVWLLSTPFGRNGFYYRCFKDEKYTHFHVSSLDCPRKDQDFLDHERSWMTKAQFAQEYLGEFVDSLRQLYPNALIDKICIGQRKKFEDGKYFLGVDIARMGEDESTFEIIQYLDRHKFTQVESIATKQTFLTDTSKKIFQLNDKYNFNKIFIDDGGMGVGVLDQLFDNPKTKRKSMGINAASKPLTRDDKKKRKLLKIDLYNNLLQMMEKGEVQLLDDDEIKLSLRSIQFEYEDTGKIKIWGSYAHHTDGIIRAAYSAKKKGLNIYVF